MTRVVVFGIMGLSPYAGVAWQTLHYLEGLRRLGCEVWYVEDTGVWAYDPELDADTDASDTTIRYVAAMMERLELGDRWAYVTAGGEAIGPAAGGLQRLLASAEVLVNLSGATVLREAHLQVPVRIYLETDPVLVQIEVSRGERFAIDRLSAHTHHFTYGENLGAADCGVPVEGFRWRATRQPIVLDWWTGTQQLEDGRYTTVANWRQTYKDIEWRGETYYWSKHREFEKVIGLPRRTSQSLELALASHEPAAVRRLRAHGWHVTDALELTRDVASYRDYVLGSRGEFTVAKDQNVRLRSGWFSDRSASYLAAGKPVITQDTGFGNVLPTGHGLFAFGNEDEAVAAIEEIESDYECHAAAARELAEEHFRAEQVLGRLLAEAQACP